MSTSTILWLCFLLWLLGLITYAIVREARYRRRKRARQRARLERIVRPDSVLRVRDEDEDVQVRPLPDDKPGSGSYRV